MSLRRFTTAGLIGLVAAGFAIHAAQEPMDFRVYYYGARGVFDGTRPVYGADSGMGWPMHYRYPPLFLLVFAPFSLLPLDWASAIWALLKCAALIVLVWSLWKRLGPPRSPRDWIVALVLAGPFVVEDFRYGNAQFFVFALTAAALLGSQRSVVWPAGALALAISFKVWPLYFIPYLLAERREAVAVWTLALTALLALLPGVYFGFDGNLSLLGQWTEQEFSTQFGKSEIWFPSQSLRGVLMRYLTVVDYSQVPDSAYPAVNIAALDPAWVRLAWIILAAAAYCGMLALTHRKGDRNGLAPASLAFSTLPLLAPFTQKYALIVLLWPAMVAARLNTLPRARWLLYAAAGVVLVQPIVPGAPAQRLMQALGFDFLAATLLAAFIVSSLAFHKNAMRAAKNGSI